MTNDANEKPLDPGLQRILADLEQHPISAADDPRVIPDTPEYDAVRRALWAKDGGDPDLFPAVTCDRRLMVRRSPEGLYFACRVDTAAEKEISQADLEALIPDLRDAVDGNGDFSADLVDAAQSLYLRPGTWDFDRQFHQRITRDERFGQLLYEHLFGLMAGCGLQTILSAAELDRLFDGPGERGATQ